MSTLRSTHPSVEHVRAYGVGRLSDEERSLIEDHLAHCDECSGILADTPADPLEKLIASAATTLATAPKMVGPGTKIEDPNAPSTDAPSRPPVSAVLDGHPRYRVLSTLGAGGMGIVFLAEHRLMKRRVALKLVNDSSLRDPETSARFHREVEVAAKLAHPNIVTAHDAEQYNGTTFLVMEYVPGTNLASLVANQGPLPVPTAVEYTRQAALGLQHAHEHGLIHRDLKPSNLMLTPKGEVKVLDFGLVRMVDRPSGFHDNRATRTGVVMGTPDYMAPEQAADSSKVDVRADVYSLGCTLYFLLVGREPYPVPSTLDKLIAHKVTPLPDPSKERNDVPQEVVAVLRKMTAKSPGDRYQSPAEVVAALSELVDSGQVSPLTPPSTRLTAGFVSSTKIINQPGKPRKKPSKSRESGKLPPKSLWSRYLPWMILPGLFLCWGFCPPVWWILPPPPWGDKYMRDHKLGKYSDPNYREEDDRPNDREPPAHDRRGFRLKSGDRSGSRE